PRRRKLPAHQPGGRVRERRAHLLAGAHVFRAARPRLAPRDELLRPGLRSPVRFATTGRLGNPLPSLCSKGRPRRPFLLQRKGPVVHVSMSRFKGEIEDIPGTARRVREAILDWLQQIEGYRGLLVLVDEKSGSACFTTFW